MSAAAVPDVAEPASSAVANDGSGLGEAQVAVDAPLAVTAPSAECGAVAVAGQCEASPRTSAGSLPIGRCTVGCQRRWSCAAPALQCRCAGRQPDAEAAPTLERLLLAADADCRADRLPDDWLDDWLVCSPREAPIEPLRDFEAASPEVEPFEDALSALELSEDEPDDEPVSDEALSDEAPDDGSPDDRDLDSDRLSLR